MITRDNYQEYFLLYVDNELSMEDRLVVEQWVAENPDLQDEWETLLSCRIDPDATVVFEDRDSLLRSVDSSVIAGHNYTEYFLSYIDGELIPKDRSLVEDFVRQHPSKKIELEQLRKTVSHPDRMIVFPDKDLLYKKEKDRRVIFFYRTLAGAAAVLLAVAALFLLRGHHTDTREVAKNLPIPPVNNPVKKEETAVTPATTAALYPTEAPKKEKKTSVKEEAVVAKTVPVLPEKQESGPVEIATITVPENKNVITAEVKKPEEPAVKTSDAVAAVQTVNISKEHSSFATQALMAEDEENEELITTASEPTQPSKSKLRGLFRKVARTLGKTADSDSEGKKEVLINAFQVAVN
ncbi:MAG: hypothetical protein JST68_21110 [Bacteroidetes bacterium]|nr:hypothetical protein [Bacteroidota bacterium]